MNQNSPCYWQNLVKEAGNNWSYLASKFVFVHSLNYTTGKTPYEEVFGMKPQNSGVPNLACITTDANLFFGVLQRSSCALSKRNQSKGSTLRQTSPFTLFKKFPGKNRNNKRIYSATFERCREQTARSHAFWNRFKVGHHLNVGKNFLSRIIAKTNPKAKNSSNPDFDPSQ